MHWCSIGFVLWSFRSWFKSGKAWTSRPGNEGLWRVTLSENKIWCCLEWSYLVKYNFKNQSISQAIQIIQNLYKTVWCCLEQPHLVKYKQINQSIHQSVKQSNSSKNNTNKIWGCVNLSHPTRYKIINQSVKQFNHPKLTQIRFEIIKWWLINEAKF